MQEYSEILGTDLVKNSRVKINNNIMTVASNYSGDAFPTENLVVGMKCFRTDRNEMYMYTLDENDNGRWLLLFKFNEDGEVVVVNATTAEHLENPPVIPDPVPTGCVQAYAGVAIPNGWLLCDGSAVDRNTYAALFTVIGTTYGAGNGTTTFNLPNLTGRVAVGAGSSYPLAAKGGEASHTLTVNELAAHNHNFTGATINTGIQSANHTHGRGTMNITGRTYVVQDQSVVGSGAFDAQMQYGYWGGGGVNVFAGILNFDAQRGWTGQTSGVSANHYHTLTTAGTIGDKGSNAAHNNMQPYIALKYIIKC